MAMGLNTHRRLNVSVYWSPFRRPPHHNRKHTSHPFHIRIVHLLKTTQILVEEPFQYNVIYQLSIDDEINQMVPFSVCSQEKEQPFPSSRI